MAISMRRSVTLAAAVATAAALGTGAVVLALPAAAEGAPPLPLTDGTLDWGIKQSFRSYLAQPFAHGRITVEDGARQAADNGVFTFVDGVGTYDTKTHGTATAFAGGVHFEAHQGALDIRISDVRLSTKGSAEPTGEITADVVTKEKDGTFSTRSDIPFAALDMTGVRPAQGAGGAMVFKDIPAKLTKDGAAAFAGFYKEGDALDAATLTVKAGSRPTTPPPTTEPPTTEPTSPEPTATTEPPTAEPTSPEPTATTEPPTTEPTSPEPTATTEPPTTEPTSPEPTATTEPPTTEPTSPEPTATTEPPTTEPTSPEPTTTTEPTSPAPTTTEPTSPAPTTTEPTSPAPTTTEPTSPAPTTTEPTSPAPTVTEPTSPAPTTTEPTSPAPTTTEPTGPAPTGGPVKVVNGKLTWGVKESWQRYVGEICGGTVTASEGAKKNGAAYDFGFVKADLDAEARKAEAVFSGRLAFVCEAHGIQWTVSDLGVKAAGTAGTLTADVTSATGTKKDVALVDLDLSKADWAAKDGVVTLADVPAKLTEAGSASFSAPGGQGGYPAGTAMDPVTVSFSLDRNATLPPSTGGTSGSGGSGSTGGSTGGDDGGSATTGGGGTVGGGDTVGGGTGGGGTVGGGTVGGGTAGGGTAGGTGSAGGSGALATTGSDVPTGLLAGASALTVAAGAAVVVAARRRTTGS
ncbi:HtaA domain-containing protein [Streptomyces sp. bgisy082]|uniref:HtaA domain-containing protein n=1 Tax=Streptomyces sp. bgisy082 TaxID=3413776 RepID=UPI003D7314A0